MNIHRLTEIVETSGQGLHTGALVHVRLVPACRGGIVFCVGPSRIPASARFVAGTDRGVVLSADGTRVKTVEHLLSALRWLGVRDLEIAVEGEEIPVMDGSALSWVKLIKPFLSDTGESFPEEPVRSPMFVGDENAFIKAAPADDFSVHYTIEYPGTPVGTQTWSGRIGPEIFLAEIAPARTFGFMSEVQELRRRGLALGGNSDNCVVITENGFLSPLRFGDEPVRHKVLDLLGDLALLSFIPRGKFEVRKGSHRLHTALAGAFEAQKNNG